MLHIRSAARGVGSRLVHSPLTLILVAYTALGILYAGAYRYQINTDAISYIEVAERYLDGNFNQAINGLWSPLLSWLIIPFMAIGISGLASIKIVSMLSGGVVIISFWNLLHAYVSSRRLVVIFTASLVPWVLHGATVRITPDMLVLACILTYLNIMLQTPSRRNALLAGLVAAVAYLAKGYNLPFFLVHYTFCQGYRFIAASRRDRIYQLKLYGIGLATFALVAVPWITLISYKYGYLTYSTSSRYNWAVFGPGGRQPHQHNGLYEPPYQESFSIWDDPSLIKLPDWSIRENWRHFSALVQRNAKEAAYHLSKSYAGWPAIVFLAVVVAVWLRQKRFSELVGFSIITALTYVAGYLMVVVQARYIWVAMVMIWLLTAAVLQRLADRWQTANWARSIVLVIITLPILVFGVWGLEDYSNSNQLHYEMATRIREKADITGKRVATNADVNTSTYIAYYLDARYLGKVRGKQPQNICGQLRRARIDYYFVWKTGAENNTVCSNMQLIYKDAALTVYDATPFTHDRSAGHMQPIGIPY